MINNLHYDGGYMYMTVINFLQRMRVGLVNMTYYSYLVLV